MGYILGIVGVYPFEIGPRFSSRLAERIDKKWSVDRITTIAHSFNSGFDEWAVVFAGYFEFLYIRGCVSHPTVANGARSRRHQFHDIFGSVEISRSQLEIPVFSEQYLAKIVIGAGA